MMFVYKAESPYFFSSGIKSCTGCTRIFKTRVSTEFTGSHLGSGHGLIYPARACRVFQWVKTTSAPV
jgi:hypothetical protein